MNRFSYILLLVVLVNSVLTKSVHNETDSSTDSEVKKRQNVYCPRTKFLCTNGQCIDKKLLCDGINHCRDGSDESDCYNSEAQSQTSGSNSKIPTGYEVYPLINEDQQETVDKCGYGEFSCSNGKCISEALTCNGVNNCGDGSDELVRLCGQNTHTSNVRPTYPSRPKEPSTTQVPFSCRQGEFLCLSGECINNNLVCNHRRDCIDGSDEAKSICPDAVPSVTTTRRPNYQNVGSGGNGFGSNSLTPCRVPPQPQNGRWRVHKSLCDSGYECDLPAGVRSMDPGSYLVYYCNKGFNLNGSKDVLCGPGGIWVHEPKCEQIKCKDLSTSSREALCMYNNLAVSCEIPVPIGTTAQLKCRQGFTLDIMLNSTYKNVTCQENGEWDPQPIQCVRKSKKVKLVLSGDMYLQEEE